MKFVNEEELNKIRKAECVGLVYYMYRSYLQNYDAYMIVYKDLRNRIVYSK